ncbi:MAG TPA: NUDIX hydrolase [Tepidisphaeraceae bacterium]|jgi:8-oxo-dGTP pyrophosphatase MutT (NUDIX family)
MLNLLLQGSWTQEQIKVSTIPSTRPIYPEVEKIIEQTWAEKKSHLGDALFDGPMSRLESFHTDGPNLHLNLSTTSYRVFLGTNLCHASLAEKFGRPALANAIGLSAALITADNKLVMGRRNDRVAYYPNRIHPFAGALEPQDVPNVFDGMQRELKEELNLSADQIQELRMLAIIEDQRLLQPEFIFVARTSCTAPEFGQSLNNAEHRDLWVLSAISPTMWELLNSIKLEDKTSPDIFTPVAVGALIMFGRHAFGDEWRKQEVMSAFQVIAQ